MLAQDQHIPELEKYLWKKTGGIPGFLATLRKESLMFAWRSGRAHVEQADIESAFNGRAMSIQHKLIEALTKFDAGEIGALTDVPADAIVARWKELGFLRPPERVTESAATDQQPSSSLPATTVASPKVTRGRKPAGKKLLEFPAESSANDAGIPHPSSSKPPAPSDETQRTHENEKTSRDAIAVPPPHHASDQHVDRRSDAYKRLLGNPPPQKR